MLPNAELTRRARLLRWFGIDRERRSGGGDFRMEPDIPEFGFKFHMNDVNATIGLINLRHVPRILEARYQPLPGHSAPLPLPHSPATSVLHLPQALALAGWALQPSPRRLRAHPRQACRANAAYYDKNLTGCRGVVLMPRPQPGTAPAYWLYTLRLVDGRRARFMEHMAAKGITVSAVHQRNDVHSCVARFSRAAGGRSSSPWPLRVDADPISLPIAPGAQAACLRAQRCRLGSLWPASESCRAQDEERPILQPTGSLLPKLNTLAEEIICLPVGWWMGEAECERVVSAVREFSAGVESETLQRAMAVKRPKCVITGGCGFIGHHGAPLAALPPP